jgi:hypothetical protein
MVEAAGKMSEISKGKKAVEAEVRKLASMVNLTSISCAWVENGTYYYLTASFGEYRFEWPFSKAQLRESSSGNVCSYISHSLRREINSLLP